MSLVLPPGVTPAAFDAALAAFAGVVGKQWVLASDEDRETYRDIYAAGDEEDHAPSAAVAPASTEQTEMQHERPSGQALFHVRCGICHEQGGTGTFMLGRRLGAQHALLEGRDDLKAAYISQVVRQGLMSMPRFTRVELPDHELDAIGRYLSMPKNAAGGKP
jgi:mono/diheme cytochrome c family protein